MNFRHESLPSSGLPASPSAEAAATAAATRGLRTSFVHVDGPAVHLGSVELRDCVLRVLRLRHFDECKSAGLARVAVGNNIHPLDVSILGKRSMQLILRRLVAEISYEDVGHRISS